MESELSERIKKANLLENPLSLIPHHFERFYKNGIEIITESKRAALLSDQLRAWCFSLLEKNMKSIYLCSKSGWNEKEKASEMFDHSAYYLIAYELKDSSKNPVAFCHFRFDMDFDYEVIYCYELQIDSESRKCGLGSHLMSILEALCEKLELDKLMLTCSKHNKIGQSFFKEKMKYEQDETDLNDEDPTVDYDILSKVFWEEESSEE